MVAKRIKQAIGNGKRAAPRQVRDVRLFSFQRLLAMALLTLRYGLRMRIWLLVPLAVAVMIVADVTSPRFDPVFERVPRTIEIALGTMMTIAILISIFLSTLTLPKEIENRSIYTVLTKPLTRFELIAGKALGLSMLLAICLAAMAVFGWAYIHVRAGQVRSLAKAEYVARADVEAFPADLGALEYVRDNGPLPVRNYIGAQGPPVVRTLKPTPPWKWILGNTGGLFAWQFEAIEMRKGIGVKLAVKVQRYEGASEEPPRVRILIRYHREILNNIPRPVRRSLRLAIVTTPDKDGRIEAPLTIPGQSGRGLDYLGYPFHITVACDSEDMAMGAKESSCEIVGPEGGRIASAVLFNLEHQRLRGSTWIKGRPRVPHQTAFFTFRNIPGAALAPGPVPVEIALALRSRGRGTAKSEARIQFHNLATGKRRGPLPFTPEDRRNALLHIPAEFWHGGDLEVGIFSATTGDQIGLQTASVRLWGKPKGFAPNFASSVLLVWAGATLVACIGTMASARVSWFVGILFTAMFFIASSFQGLLFSSLWIAPHHHGESCAADTSHWITDLGGSLWQGLGWIARKVLPDFDRIWPGEFTQKSMAMPWEYLAGGLALALGYSLGAILVGWVLLKWREVA